MSKDLQFSPEFPNLDDTDLILISKDEVAFGIQKCILQVHSSVFFGMVKMPTNNNETPTVKLEETSQVLTCLLEVCYGKDNFLLRGDSAPIDLILDLLVIADKYEVQLLLGVCRLYIQLRLAEKNSWEEAVRLHLCFYHNNDDRGMKITYRAFMKALPLNQQFDLDDYKQYRFFDNRVLLELSNAFYKRTSLAVREMQLQYTGQTLAEMVRNIYQGTWHQHLQSYSQSFSYINRIEALPSPAPLDDLEEGC
ncbi:hypothetical protein BT69DRAFT_1344076 [Atractiella rhizophila]|nr:hypothetical protein BT69DRAFT_1344076 [Atractiella rhizophila]